MMHLHPANCTCTIPAGNIYNANPSSPKRCTIVPVLKLDGLYNHDNKKLRPEMQIDIPSPSSLAQPKCRCGGCPQYKAYTTSINHCDSIHFHLDSETAGLECKARLTPNSAIRHDSKPQPFIFPPHILPLNGSCIPYFHPLFCIPLYVPAKIFYIYLSPSEVQFCRAVIYYILSQMLNVRRTYTHTHIRT